MTKFGTKKLVILWIFSCLPLVEIFRNEMIARIVTTKYREIDTIEELLQSDLNVYALTNDKEQFTDLLSKLDRGEFEQLFNNFNLLLNRTDSLVFEDPKFASILLDPVQMLDTLHSYAVLEDEWATKFLVSVSAVAMDLHVSKEGYLAELITPICFHKSFAYVKEAQRL